MIHFLLVLLFLLNLVTAAIVVSLNGTTYYSYNNPVAFLRLKLQEVYDPLPVLFLQDVPATIDDFVEIVTRLLSEDDMLSESFLSNIVIPDGVQLSRKLIAHLKTSSTRILVATRTNGLPTGPYLVHESETLGRVYRVYVDDHMAFVQGIVDHETSHKDKGRFKPCSVTAGQHVNGAIGIPVPSRHYFPKPSVNRPLSGLRLVIKDVFDLDGIKAGAGSRAYFELYPPATQTAPSIQRLIDLGAVAVGKVKTSQFAAGEIPTSNYVDQIAPFNPRGDGYQSPSASSCGTGAALAAYKWLDLGAGTDTTGSIRGPAMANGLFGMRISNGSLPLRGILPVSPLMDTPGLIVRDARLLRAASKKWFKAKEYKSFPKRIILPTQFWKPINQTNPSKPVYNRFISGLSELMGAEAEYLDTSISFMNATQSSEDIGSYIGGHPQVLIRDRWQAVGLPFITKYQEEKGRFPYINPVPRSGLVIATNIDATTYNEALRRLMVYKEWFISKLVPTCETSIVVYPLSEGLEFYRDETLRVSPGVSSAYPNTLQAAAAGLLDYAVPIGVRRYNSTVSRREEELPISVGIIGAQGCDNMLLDLVVEMESKGLKTVVKTGRYVY